MSILLATDSSIVDLNGEKLQTLSHLEPESEVTVEALQALYSAANGGVKLARYVAN